MNLCHKLPTRLDWPTFVCCFRWCVIAACLLGLSSCTSRLGPKSEIVVSVKDQRLGLYQDGVLQKQYAISTSKFGLGDQLGSYKTPLGKHEVIAKIGHGLPTGAVLKSRSWNGEVLKPNAPGRDPIVSRILWLRGMETNNRNAMKRFIYIHGTTEEDRLGKPASFGCIRMGMRDVVDLFNDVSIGAKVEITKNRLPQGAEKPKLPEAAPAAIEPTDPAHLAAGPPPTPKTADAGAAAIPQPAEANLSPTAEPTVKQENAIPTPETRVRATADPEKVAGASGPSAMAEAAPTDSSPVTSGPSPVEKAPQRKRGGWFGLFSKKENAPAVEAPMAAAATASDAMAQPIAATTAMSQEPSKVETAEAQATASVMPAAGVAAPPDPSLPPAMVEPTAPRKRSGFFGFFRRSPAAPQAIAAVAEEKVSPERSEMNANPPPISPGESPPANPETHPAKPDATVPKPRKDSSMKMDDVRGTVRQMPMQA